MKPKEEMTIDELYADLRRQAVALGYRVVTDGTTYQIEKSVCRGFWLWKKYRWEAVPNTHGLPYTFVGEIRALEKVLELASSDLEKLQARYA